jgi:integrase
VGSKEVRRSLRTTDKPLAKRRLADLQRDLARVDLTAGKYSLAEMCDRYLATVQSQKPKTVKRKREIAARLKRDFPGGADTPISRTLHSRVGSLLASYDFGAASYNLYLEFVRAVLALAVEDKVMASSPVETLKGKRRSRPTRQTPTPEEFRAIAADIRAQQVFNPLVKDTADFVEFIGLAGLGQAEAGSLTWADIDWQKERITTFRHKTSQGFQIPIYPQLRPLLERMRQERGGSPPGEEKVLTY